MLSRPLVRPVATLPTGTSFARYAGQSGGGIAHYSNNSLDDSALWRSLGDHIVITWGDGNTGLLPWKDLDAVFRQKEDKYWQRENAHPDGPPIPFQSRSAASFAPRSLIRC